jgi:hypothetical protein
MLGVEGVGVGVLETRGFLRGLPASRSLISEPVSVSCSCSAWGEKEDDKRISLNHSMWHNQVDRGAEGGGPQDATCSPRAADDQRKACK